MLRVKEALAHLRLAPATLHREIGKLGNWGSSPFLGLKVQGLAGAKSVLLLQGSVLADRN